MLKIIRPVSKSIKINQGFGVNPQVYRKFALAGHNGLDFAVKFASEIVSVATGRVKAVGEDTKSYGLYIIITYDGFETIYAHLSQVFVRANDAVHTGQKIARSGNSGFVLPRPTVSRPYAGSHLHFGLRILTKNNKVKNRSNGYHGYIDPEPYFINYDSGVGITTSRRIFADVTKSHPYYQSIVWAKQNGIIHGFKNDGTLRPDEPLSLGRLLAVLQNYDSFSKK